MYPPGYSALAWKEKVHLDLLHTDCLSAYRSFACREAGYPYIQVDRDQIGDVLPYRETRIKVLDKSKGGEEVVDVMKIFKDEGKPPEMSLSTKVSDLVNLAAGRTVRSASEEKHDVENDNALHAVVVFIHEGKLTSECIRELTCSFNLTPQFWDYYGTACILNSASTMVKGLRETPTDDVTLHLCHPIGTVSSRAEKQINFDFSTPSFFLKWQRDANKEKPSNDPEVLLFCLLSPKTNYEELRDAIDQAYRDPSTKAVLSNDPYGLIGIVMLQWLGWSQELFYQLEQLVRGIESDLIENDLSPRRAGKQGYEVNFSQMHRISKHIIQYLDSLQVTASLQDSLVQSHESLRNARGLNKYNKSFRRVDDALPYYRLAFIGVKSRVVGLKSRMDNQINLAFNLTQQRDAQVAQGTNKSMYSLSVITLAFLPLTAVASVLAMPYFSVHDSDLTWVGSKYTLAWAIGTALLVTLVVLVFWGTYVYYGSRSLIWRRRAEGAAKDGEAV